MPMAAQQRAKLLGLALGLAIVAAAVAHYDRVFALGLTLQQQADLAAYLRTR